MSDWIRLDCFANKPQPFVEQNVVGHYFFVVCVFGPKKYSFLKHICFETIVVLPLVLAIQKYSIFESF